MKPIESEINLKVAIPIYGDIALNGGSMELPRFIKD
jgi:hypothetical protein